MVSSETLNEKLPIRAFSPLNVKANCLVTSSLLPRNFSKKGSHCISLRIEMQFSWYWELSNMLGSTLLVILAESCALTLLCLCFANSTKKFWFVTFCLPPQYCWLGGVLGSLTLAPLVTQAMLDWLSCNYGGGRTQMTTFSFRGACYFQPLLLKSQESNANIE